MTKYVAEMPDAETIERDGELKADWSPDSMLYEYKGKLYEISYACVAVGVSEYKGEAP